MTRPIAWTPSQVEFLFILHEVLGYNFTICADEMERETKRSVTKNSMISLYNRQTRNGYRLPASVVEEVEQAAGLA